VHGLDLRAAARTLLAGAAVYLQRHRRLVGERVANDLLVVRECAAQALVDRAVQPLDRVVVQVVALAKRRELGGPEHLVDPRAADAGDRALVAQQRMQMARLIDQLGELVERRRRPRLGSERDQ
jgi:hypothetical protein